MRKNPYLKQEQEFRPLLMRGSLGNCFLTTNEQAKKELEHLSIPDIMEYTLDEEVSFEMLQPPYLNQNGMIIDNRNIELCTTECTQDLFQAVMGFNHSQYKGLKDSPKRPIENVTWYDCISFCNKLSRMFGYEPYYKIFDIRESNRYPDSIEMAKVRYLGGHGFRLPTAEEWETFAKAGTSNTWSGTNNESDLGDYAWYKANGGFKTHLVSTKKPNEWGMYDMTGNVEEWCGVIGPTLLCTLKGCSTFTHGTIEITSHSFNFPGYRGPGQGFRFARTIE